MNIYAKVLQNFFNKLNPVTVIKRKIHHNQEGFPQESKVGLTFRNQPMYFTITLERKKYTINSTDTGKASDKICNV